MPTKQRLNDIIKYLESNESASIGELAKLFNVSTKTISRDLSKLARVGVYRNGHRWRMDKTKALDDLNSDDRLVLGILDELAKGVGAEFGLKAHLLLEKLTQNLFHPIFVNLDNEKLECEDFARFELLEYAIKQKREISFLFRKYEFIVQPLKLAFLDGFWYLFAFDVSETKNQKSDIKNSHIKPIFKKFYFKNIENIVLEEAYFSVDSAILERLEGAKSAWFNLDEPFMVELFIPKEITKYFKRKVPKHGHIIPDDEGNLTLLISITHEMEILPLIYRYLPYIKVLSPNWLRERIIEDIKQYLSEVE